MRFHVCVCFVVAWLLSLFATHSLASESVVEPVEQRSATIISEGVRLHADLYYPKHASAQPLPPVIMSYGWGGTADMLNRQASDIFVSHAICCVGQALVPGRQVSTYMSGSMRRAALSCALRSPIDGSFQPGTSLRRCSTLW